jgi:patatin-like phospholipase/acyl hydrolase
MSISEKLRKTGPRKLLSLDGGGIRGVLSLAVLAKIERLLGNALGRGENFVLADYFDYVAGTSTGAIIAACISLGLPIGKIQQLYRESGKDMFDKASWFERFLYKYEDNRLSARLKEILGADTTLGSGNLRTLLLVTTRNATTGSAWCVSNNPVAKYNLPGRPDSNLDLPLWQLVRASTAAPSFFPPETMHVGGTRFVFVDGGVTTYNNPAFQLFLMATVEPFNLRWPAGEDKILLVSVGTGRDCPTNPNLEPQDMNLLYDATTIPSDLINAAQAEQDFLCRVFGKCVIGDPVNREAGDLIGAGGPVSPKLFTYARYNADLTRAALDGLGLADINPQSVEPMDAVTHMDDLERIGAALAQKVRIDHFAGFLEK